MTPQQNTFIAKVMSDMKVDPLKSITAYSALAANVFDAPDTEKSLWMSITQCIRNDLFGVLRPIRELVADHALGDDAYVQTFIAKNFLDGTDTLGVPDIRAATEKLAAGIPGCRCVPYIREVIDITDLKKAYVIFRMFHQLVNRPGEKSVFCESYPSYVLSNMQLRVVTGVNTAIQIDGRARPWLGVMPTIAAVTRQNYTAVWSGLMEYMVWTGTYRDYTQAHDRLQHRASLIQRSLQCSEDVYRTLLFTLKDWLKISPVSQDLLCMCAAFMQHEVEVLTWPHSDKTLYCSDLFDYAVRALQYSMDITVIGASPIGAPKLLNKK